VAFWDRSLQYEGSSQHPLEHGGACQVYRFATRMFSYHVKFQDIITEPRKVGHQSKDRQCTPASGVHMSAHIC
jgi:hypothetical protein